MPSNILSLHQSRAHFHAYTAPPPVALARPCRLCLCPDSQVYARSSKAHPAPPNHRSHFHKVICSISDRLRWVTTAVTHIAKSSVLQSLSGIPAGTGGRGGWPMPTPSRGVYHCLFGGVGSHRYPQRSFTVRLLEHPIPDQHSHKNTLLNPP